MLPVVVQVRVLMVALVVAVPLQLRPRVTQVRRVRRLLLQRRVVVREAQLPVVEVVVAVVVGQRADEAVEPVILRAGRRFVAKVQIHKNSPASRR